jgi:6-phosphogluconolactonase
MTAAASRDVQFFGDASELTHAAAEAVVESALEAVRATGRFVIALSGGSTPNALFELLASDAYVRRIDWSRVHVFWGDERCVPPDDAASNYRSARDRLLARVAVPEPQVHRIHGEDDPTAAAAAYEQDLRATFATPTGPPRQTPGTRFDLVLLGMGPDGHTASLFPSTAAVRETERWVVAHRVAAVSMWRITLTPVVLAAAADVVFLVAGRDKAATLHRVLDGPYQPEMLPSQAIRPTAGRLRWLVDAAAAAELERR